MWIVAVGQIRENGSVLQGLYTLHAISVVIPRSVIIETEEGRANCNDVMNYVSRLRTPYVSATEHQFNGF